MNRAEHVTERAAPWRRYGPDLLIVIVLLVVAFLARRGGLPTDGLWLDDAIPAAGLNASLTQLLVVGNDHPGFIAALMGWSQLSGGSADSLAYLPLLAGLLSPPLLYLALRHLDFERSVSALLAAALTAAEAHVVYSGRVKSYTLDFLVVLALAVVVPWLARKEWSWQLGLMWVVATVTVASLSGFAMIAVGVAGAILVLHPASDIRIRLVAVGAQAAALVALLAAEARTYNVSNLEIQWREEWDAFVSFDPNPVSFVGDGLEHLNRVAETFPGGPTWLPMTCVFAVLLGLGVSAWRGSGALTSRYLLLVVAVAFGASVFGKLPFGPEVGSSISNGQRVSLWLIPVFAVGIAYALSAIRAIFAGSRFVRSSFDIAAGLGATAILISSVAGDSIKYPYPGAESATAFLLSNAGSQDALLLPWPSQYSFAAESDLATGIEAQPESAFGFEPTFTDARFFPTDVFVTDEQLLTVEGARRVLVYLPNPFNSVETEWEKRLSSGGLSALGFTPRAQAKRFTDVKVRVWKSGETGASGEDVSDFPLGWQLTPTPVDPVLFECLGLSTEGATQNTVTAVPPDSDGKLFVLSTTVRWPSLADAQAAQQALAGDDALDCVGESLEATLSTINLPARVDARRVMPPEGGSGASTVAFTQAIQVTDGSSPFAPVALVYLSDGVDSVLINGFSLGEKPFPLDLLRRFVESAAD